jgi:hypothetical protein
MAQILQGSKKVFVHWKHKRKSGGLLTCQRLLCNIVEGQEAVKVVQDRGLLDAECVVTCEQCGIGTVEEEVDRRGEMKETVHHLEGGAPEGDNMSKELKWWQCDRETLITVAIPNCLLESLTTLARRTKMLNEVRGMGDKVCLEGLYIGFVWLSSMPFGLESRVLHLAKVESVGIGQLCQGILDSKIYDMGKAAYVLLLGDVLNAMVEEELLKAAHCGVIVLGIVHHNSPDLVQDLQFAKHVDKASSNVLAWVLVFDPAEPAKCCLQL